MLLIIVVVVWKEQNKPLTESQAKEMVREMNDRFRKMESYLWSGLEGDLPLLKMGRTYELPDYKGYKTYQKTDDPNIKTIEQVKKETEKVLTQKAAEVLIYRYCMNNEYPFYVEYDGLLYLNIGISRFLTTGSYEDAEIVEWSNDTIVAEMLCSQFDPTFFSKYSMELLKIKGNWYINRCERIEEGVEY